MNAVEPTKSFRIPSGMKHLKQAQAALCLILLSTLLRSLLTVRFNVLKGEHTHGAHMPASCQPRDVSPLWYPCGTLRLKFAVLEGTNPVSNFVL